jgi:threonine aldolase
MAARLGAGVEAIDGVELLHPVQANGVFVRLPQPVLEQLLDELPGEHPFYTWEEGPDSARWMCSWDTPESDVDALHAAVRSAVSA